MPDPTQGATPNTPGAEGPRRWPFTFTQVRLGVLMAALAFGLTGMVRNDVRLLDLGIGLAVVGVGMRLWRRWRQRQREG